MPQGYDFRQVARDTFATQPVAPVQGGRGATASGNRTQIVGGRSQGTGVTAGKETDAGPVAAGLGRYFAELIEPMVQRREQELFFKGYNDAQNGIALDEIDNSNKGLNKIFGPSAYEEGANFYTAKDQLNRWSTETAAQIDDLKKLHPDVVAKRLAEQSQALLTGHGPADQIIQNGVIEASGPLLNTIAKARFAWQQEEAVKAMNSAAVSGATSLQAILSEQAKLTDPADRDTAASKSAVQGFLGNMAKPEGMTDDSYKSFLYDFMAKSMQDGNFYAVEAMKRAGVTDVFGEDDNKKLDDAYRRYGNRVLGKAALGEADALIRLDTLVKTEKISAVDAARELSDINNRLKAETGVDLDLFDYSDIRKMAGSVTDVLVASVRRAEARGWQIEDRERSIQARREDEAREDAQTAAQVQALYGMGQTEGGKVAGLKGTDFDMLALRDYRQGNYSTIIQNFNQGGTVFKPVASAMQAKVTSSVGQEYSKDTGAAYEEWKSIYGQSPAAAQAYYGNHHIAFQKFDRLVRGGVSNQVAFQKSFGDPSIYGTADIPREIRTATNEAVDEYVGQQSFSIFSPTTWGNDTLNESSKQVIGNALKRTVAVTAKNSDLPIATIVEDSVKVMRANGSLEQYGAFAWTNRPGTKPLHNVLGLQPEETGKLLTQEIETRMIKAGSTKGARADVYEITRIRGPEGGVAIWVREPEEDKQVLITEAELKERANAHIASKRKRREQSLPVINLPTL